MRRLGLARRSLNSSPAPSPPIRNSTLDSVFTDMSERTGDSMDSYVSDIPTDDTSVEGGGGGANNREEESRGKTESPEVMPADKGDDGKVPALKLDTGGGLKLPDRGERPSSPAKLLGHDDEGEGEVQGKMDGLRIETGKNDESGERVGNLESSGHMEDDTPVQSQNDTTEAHLEPDISDSPVDAEDAVQLMDSPVDHEEGSDGKDEAEVQVFDSPVEDEAEQVPTARSIKGRPRPRPRP